MLCQENKTTIYARSGLRSVMRLGNSETQGGASWQDKEVAASPANELMSNHEHSCHVIDSYSSFRITVPEISLAVLVQKNKAWLFGLLG